MNYRSALSLVFNRKIIETFACSLCGSPDRIIHDKGLLLIPGRCSKCGKDVEYDNSKVLNTLAAVWERGNKRD